MREPVVAIDLGGTNLRAALVRADGEIIRRDKIPTPVDDPRPDALTSLMRTMADGSDCRRAVVGIPGRIDNAEDRLVDAPNLPDGWDAWLTEAWLAEETGLSVSLANDADLAAVGEGSFGAGRHAADVVYVTISTGIGAGVMLGDRVVVGRFSGGEIGHTIADIDAHRRGAPDTVETIGSGSAIQRRLEASELTERGAAFTDLVRDGVPAAVAIFDEAMTAAAVGITNLAWIFAPSMVVIGGGVGLNADLVHPPIRSMLGERGPELGFEIEVVAAELGDDAALVGAAAWFDAIGRSS